jgi:glutamate synthase domain-containing protein 2
MNPEKGFGRRLVVFIDWFGRLWRSHVTENDRGELPFNRAERDSVTHLANKEGDIVAFGSTRDLSIPGTPVFVNCQFPTLDRDAVRSKPLTVGPFAAKPYSVSSIFNISAMSYGALSPVAVRALSKGAKLAGAWLNTGEGGLAPAHLEGGCDIVFQIGTAKYGVRDAEGGLDLEKLKQVAAHPQVKMIEIKLAQGAKPGKGGILPGIKVNKEIAEIRGIPEGKDSISPNRHPEIGSVGELLDMVKLVRGATGLPVGFKTVLSEEQSIEDLCAEIKKRGAESAPDFITLDGGDGGTGAAPMALIDNVGLTLKDSLPMLVGALTRNGLRDRIPVIASGKLITPASIAWALCAGASFVNSARGPMRSLGCVQARECDRNTCPTGITTTNPRLQSRLDPAEKSVKVANYLMGATDEVEVIAHSCGVAEPRGLGPQHVRIVQKDGPPRLLSELHPDLVRRPAAAPPPAAAPQ